MIIQLLKIKIHSFIQIIDRKLRSMCKKFLEFDWIIFFKPRSNSWERKQFNYPYEYCVIVFKTLVFKILVLVFKKNHAFFNFMVKNFVKKLKNDIILTIVLLTLN